MEEEIRNYIILSSDEKLLVTSIFGNGELMSNLYTAEIMTNIVQVLEKEKRS